MRAKLPCNGPKLIPDGMVNFTRQSGAPDAFHLAVTKGSGVGFAPFGKLRFLRLLT